tara:strand:- start:90 stop:1010 length:921 start_codon:yes stop_codon:yes gene_type:complete
LTEKLEDLKRRAQNLRYKDEKELDDIIRKSKMYLEKLFPNKFTYASEIGQIRFFPGYYVSGMGDRPYRESWSKGQQKLINLLDTRIEELKLESSKPKSIKPEVQVVERIVEVQDQEKINELTQEINTLRQTKSLWSKINWGIFIPILLSIIGGAYYFGYQNGKAQFDIEKLELFETNKVFLTQNDSLKTALDASQELVSELEQLVPDNSELRQKFPLKVRISFLSPTSIFNGSTLISAKEDFGDKAILDFKGIKGVSKLYSGDFDSLRIEIKQGDRFYIKDEKGVIYPVNVLSSGVDVDLEITEKK